MIYGKLLAGLIGLLTGGLFGAIIGVAIGHLFDRGLASTLRLATPANLRHIQTSFFETSFLLLGYLAKADGRVSQAEIDHTEALFRQMRLSAEQRQRAIGLFQRGAAAGFQPEPVLAQFLEVCGPVRRLHQSLLLFLVALALADQILDQAEYDALQRIAVRLGFSAVQLDQLLRMARAQEHFHHDGSAGAAQPGTRIEDAYAALGVSPAVGDRELKRAYRKLMSEHHPDKLIARGVPEDMVKLATERAQEIQSAYAMIRKHRDGAGVTGAKTSE